MSNNEDHNEQRMNDLAEIERRFEERAQQLEEKVDTTFYSSGFPEDPPDMDLDQRAAAAIDNRVSERIAAISEPVPGCNDGKLYSSADINEPNPFDPKRPARDGTLAASDIVSVTFVESGKPRDVGQLGTLGLSHPSWGVDEMESAAYIESLKNRPGDWILLVNGKPWVPSEKDRLPEPWFYLISPPVRSWRWERKTLNRKQLAKLHGLGL